MTIKNELKKEEERGLCRSKEDGGENDDDDYG